MTVTIGEIAKKAGVSKTTVSRVLNNKPDVDPSTRERIMKLIAEYDYQPNAFAKAITLQKSHHIGLLIPHKAEYVFTNPFYTDVMHGVSTEVDRQEYYLLVCYAHEVNYLDIYKQKRVDGFVLLSPGSYHKTIIETLNRGRVPFVSTAMISNGDQITYVDVDNFHGARLVMDHLISLGHKRIAYIGKPSLKSSQDRLNGYKAALQEYGLPIDENLILISDTSSVESGHNCTLNLLNQEQVPSAIFLANDVMAIGAIQAIQQTGRHVPEDVSVVGFDDIPLARYVTPPLTTVRQPAFEKGVLAARMLIETLESDQTPEPLILDVELILRSSTALAK